MTVAKASLAGLAAVACLLAASPSIAGDGRFLYIGADAEGAGFINLTTMTSGPHPVVDILFVPRQASNSNHRGVYFGMVKMRVNCAARTTALISAKTYSETGELVNSEGPRGAEPVKSTERPAMNTLKVACKLPGAPNDMIFGSSTAAIKWWHLQ